MAPGPLVSVLINNYNYAPFLAAAIDSALAQDYANFEVVVVDDGSTDSSREIIRSYGDRIVAVMKENGGQASAFNAGFAASKGEILCFLDSDDLFLPEKVGRVVRIFEEHPEIGWCFDLVREFDHTTGVRGPAPAGAVLGSWDERRNIAAGKTPFIPTATSGLSYRRSLMDRMLPMTDGIRITSDGFIKLVALGLSQGWMTGEELTLQRIHGENFYTHRTVGRKHIAGVTGVLTGIYLYNRFPTLRRLATTLFARGLGQCWVAGGAKDDYEPYTSDFLNKVPVSTRLEVLATAGYWSARYRLSGLKEKS